MRTVRFRSAAAVVLAATFLPAAPARAGDAIMPLSQVTKGMRCTAYTVVQGTTISPFAVEVVDVVEGAGAADARILVRVSGPAVDQSGVAEGYSGSPVYCPAQDGNPQVAGAISEGIGQYGNTEVLATPIEQVLDQPAQAPIGARRDPALLRRGRPLAVPLSVSGLSGSLAQAVRDGARAAGRPVLAAPGAPARDFPVQDLVPGASVAAGLSSGAFSISGIGTVSYRDGDRVWAFGHPLDQAGRRSLFLQDAYVFDVVASPLPVQGATSYKLAAPGHVVGALTADGVGGVAGRLGAPPPQFPVRALVSDDATGRVRSLSSLLADETGIGLPTGQSALGLVASLSEAKLVTDLLGGVPLRSSGEMCLRIAVRGEAKPLRFCNRYLTGPGGAISGLPSVLPTVLSADIVQASSLIDAFNFGPLALADVQVEVHLGRPLRQTFMLGASGPRRVKPGQRLQVVVKARDRNGGPRTIRVPVTVPRDVGRGARTLMLHGTDLDAPQSGFATVIGGAILQLDAGPPEAEPGASGPRSYSELRREVARIRRYDGIRAEFVKPEEGGTDQGSTGGSSPSSGEDTGVPQGVDPITGDVLAPPGVKVLRPAGLRVSGEVELPVVVSR